MPRAMTQLKFASLLLTILMNNRPITKFRNQKIMTKWDSLTNRTLYNCLYLMKPMGLATGQPVCPVCKIIRFIKKDWYSEMFGHIATIFLRKPWACSQASRGLTWPRTHTRSFKPKRMYTLNLKYCYINANSYYKNWCQNNFPGFKC